VGVELGEQVVGVVAHHLLHGDVGVLADAVGSVRSSSSTSANSKPLPKFTKVLPWRLRCM